MESSDEEYEEEDSLGYIIDDYKVFLFLKNELVDKIYDAANECRVLVEPFSDGQTSGFMIEGPKKGIERMKEKMNGFMEHLGEFQTDLDVIDGGYLMTEEGLKFVKKVEGNCHVQCEVLLPQVDTTDAKGRVSASRCWRLPDGQSVTILQDSIDSSGAHVVVETYETVHEEDYKIQGVRDVIRVQFPIQPFRDKSSSPKRLTDNMAKLLDAVISRRVTSVAFTLERQNTWAIDVYVTAVLTAFLTLAGGRDKSQRTLSLCATDPNVYGRGCQVCDAVLTGKGSRFGASAEHTTEGQAPINITVVEGALDAMKADALVCTIADDLDLTRGAVSCSLLDTAGDALQYELDRYYPDGLSPGKIAVTHGHCLKCKHVFYGVMYPYDDEFCQSYDNAEDYYKVSVHDFVYASMRTAEKLKVRSIAFPAIGSGNLFYPISIVVDQMFHSVESFQQDKGTCIKDVRFVVYPTDKEALAAFRAKEEQYVAAQKAKLYKSMVEAGKSSEPTTVRITGMEADVEKALQHFQDRIERIQNLARSASPKGASSDQTPLSPGTTGERQTEAEDRKSANSSRSQTGDHSGRSPQKQKRHTGSEFPLETTFDGSEVRSPSQKGGDSENLDKKERKDELKAPIETSFDGSEVASQPHKGDDTTHSSHKHTQKALHKAPIETSFDGSEVASQPHIGDDTTHSSHKHTQKALHKAPIETSFDGSEVASQPHKGDDTTHSSHKHTQKALHKAPIETSFDGSEVASQSYRDDSKHSHKPEKKVSRAPTETTFDDSEVTTQSQHEENREHSSHKQDKKASSRAAVETTFDDNDEMSQPRKGDNSQSLSQSQERKAGIRDPNETPVANSEASSTDASKSGITTPSETAHHEEMAGSRAPIADFDDSISIPSAATGQSRISVQSETTMSLLEYFRQDLLSKFRNFGCDVMYKDGFVVLKGEPQFVEVIKVELNSAIHKLNDLQTDTLDVSDVDDEDIHSVVDQYNTDGVLCIYRKASNETEIYSLTYDKTQEVKLAMELQFGKRKITRRTERDLKAEDEMEEDENFDLPEHEKDDAGKEFESENTNNPENEHVGKESESEYQHGARPKTFSRQFSWSKQAKDVQIFQTNERLVVKVYSADILCLPVDCIVNAANVGLSHGGGIALAISKAAGRDLDKEGEKILKKTGKLQVGGVCSTTAGKLSYSCVIHAVGPCWAHYKPYTLEKVKQCESDLHDAILFSLMEAENKGLKTIAIPAVSSAKFGCPEDLCTVQYAQAILDYSKSSENSSSRLEEIHFVDMDIKIVKVIQVTFKSMIPHGHKPKFYEIMNYVKQPGADEGKHTLKKKDNLGKLRPSDISAPKGGVGSPKSEPKHQGSVADKNSSKTDQSAPRSRIKSSQNATPHQGSTDKEVKSSQSATPYSRSVSNQAAKSATKSDTESPQNAAAEQKPGITVYPHCTTMIPPGHGSEEFVCFISPKIKLHVYTGDLFTLKNIDMVACSNKSHGNGTGFVAEKLKEKGGPAYVKDKDETFKRRKPDLGHIVVCSGGQSCFKYVAHAILYQIKDTNGKEDRQQKVDQVFTGIFINAKKFKCSSLALPLLGTGKGNADPEYYARRFVESLYAFYPWNKDYVFNVHLVNIDSDKTNIAINTITTAVSKLARPFTVGRGRGAPREDKSSPSAGLSSVGGRRGRRGGGAGMYSTLPSRSGRNSTSSTTSEDAGTGGGSYTTLPGRRGRGIAKNTGRSQHDTTNSSDKAGDDNSMSNSLYKMPISKKGNQSSADNSTANLDPCVICMDDMTDPKFLPCGHGFCTNCIDQSFRHKKVCPTCGAVWGKLKGDQPEGTIDIQYSKKKSVAGYESCGRIEITYSFPSGTQGKNHPSPGKLYKGITRTAFLPDNNKGRQISEMLQVAFERKLVFTIGHSRTTGQEGVITWNDIHHKTDPNPNNEFGYPDPTYLDRVVDELSAKGVTLDDIATPVPKKRN